MKGFNEEMRTKCLLLKCLLSADAALVMEIYRIVAKKSERELTVKELAGLCHASC